MTKFKKRLLEIVPGFVSWNLILFLVWGGLFFPVFTAYFILAFDVYWIYNGLSLTIAVLLAHFEITASNHMDWLREAKEFGEDFHKVKHIVLILVGNEPQGVVEKTVVGLANQTLPLKQIAVVLGAEGRNPKVVAECQELQKKWQSKFGDFLVTVHPPDLPGELKGKSSNEAWAGRKAKEVLVDEKGWDIRFLTITSNDADAILDHQYFACLTYKFLDDPHRWEKFWQPTIVFYNNIWKIPMITRVINTFGNIWQTGLVARKDRLINFSNYSASLVMIDKIGYWDTDVIPEDYRIFFKAFFALKGQVEVEPIFLMSSADAPESSSTWKTLVNDYKQKQRWAWGVSDLPLFVEMYLTDTRTSFINKSIRMFRILQDHVLWPVNWFIVTVGVPIVTLVNPEFGRTSLGYNLPRLSSWLLSSTLVFLVILLIVEYRQRPKGDNSLPRWRRWLSPLEFVLMPVAGFFFSALPGLDAHTRLMLGRYLEYRITEKVA